MKRSLKKIGLVSIAAVFMGASINGLALAANSDDDKADRMEQTMPPMMHKMMKDIELTDKSKNLRHLKRSKRRCATNSGRYSLTNRKRPCYKK